MNQNPTYKTYGFDVTERGQLVAPPDINLDKNVSTIKGLALSSNKRGVLFNYGSQRIELGGAEIFPEGHPSNMLMFGITGGEKTHRFADPIPAGNGILRVAFKDTWIAPAVGQPDDWTPYRVFITLEQVATR